MRDVIVGIDIGTTKVCTLIGIVNKANQMEIFGEGIAPCKSVKKGIIIDIDSTSRAIKQSVEQAEKQAQLKVGSAYININGLHTNVLNYKENIEISSQNKLISTDDLDKLYDKIETMPIEEGTQIIDIIPREYILDGNDCIKDPIGMSGIELYIDADLVVSKLASVKNIVKSVEKAGLEVDGIIVEAFGTSELALTSEEKDSGVVLIDVGGGVTDVSAFKNGNILMNGSIPVGGEHITNDVSIGLHMSINEAEKVKKQYELALTSLIKNDQEVSIYDVNDEIHKTLNISEVIEIIEARVVEILSLSRNLVETHADTDIFSCGIVLTGGGISYLNGNKLIASEIFELPAKVASYRSYSATIKPESAAAAGIIKYVAARNRRFSVTFSSTDKSTIVKKKNEGLLRRIFKAIQKALF